jgi:hypothetical protein
LRAERPPACRLATTIVHLEQAHDFRPGVAVAVAAFIAAQRDQHRIPHAVACRALGVSRSWFYKWKDDELPPRAALTAEARRVFKAHRGTYGSPRITADLREAG